MNFHELSLPSAKRHSPDSSLKAFPIDEISGDKQFTGIFNGLSVEIIESEAIRSLYTNGFFGISSKTKSAPTVLHRFPRIQNVTQPQYERKLAWNAKYTNKNPNVVMLNLAAQEIRTSANDKNAEEKVGEIQMKEKLETQLEENVDATNSSDIESDEENCVPEDQPIKIVEHHGAKHKINEQNSIADPFPIEDTLVLFPEEAFFLHFSLKCLKILNFDETHEFTTDELFERFSGMNPKFIQRFIVYHYYRSKNWIVKSGMKFGGDFLLYYKGPTYYHASYVVLVYDSHDEINQLDMQSNYRVADSTKKEMIIATITRPNDFLYTNRTECLKQLKEYQITEIIPKRFTLNQLS